jgi:phosphotransferase system HPr-like phosphotransfer protein
MSRPFEVFQLFASGADEKMKLSPTMEILMLGVSQNTEISMK